MADNLAGLEPSPRQRAVIFMPETLSFSMPKIQVNHVVKKNDTDVADSFALSL
jgi:hypothetical protein